MKSKTVFRKVVLAVLPVVIVLLAFLAARRLVRTKPLPKRRPASDVVSLVEMQVAVATNALYVLEGAGVVSPVAEIDVVPEVTGQIVWKHPDLLPGGVVREGEELLRIDARDYDFAVRQELASVQRAELEAEIEASRKRIAEREWTLLGEDGERDPEGQALALREPQQRVAEAVIDGARGRLGQAELKVEKTVIRAPFNAVVIDESIDVGQIVSPQSRLASLAGIDAFHVQVSVPVGSLRWLAPQGMDTGAGAPVTILQDLGDGDTIVCTGSVDRLIGDLDPAGRMARLLVTIDRPWEQTKEIPLLLNAYVRASIAGPAQKNAFVIPERAVRDEDTVWVMDDTDALDIRGVRVAWIHESMAVVLKGIGEGDRIVTSRIPIPIPGMKLRIANSED